MHGLAVLDAAVRGWLGVNDAQRGPRRHFASRGSPFGFLQNRTVTCRVPNSCSILRATAVTHGYSWSALSFAHKRTA
jgi:hypothetical protein